MKNELKYAFIKSVPVMCGYLFLGMAFGIVLEEAGYNYLWALLMSGSIFAGSMQFVMVPLMVSGASIVTVALTTLFVNSRHLFYGLSFIESFNKMKTKPYMIFSLTDETYSVLCGCKNEDKKEKHRNAWFYIALFDQCYWVIGSVVGALLGNILPFDFTGIDFSMTALFVVILVEQILSGKLNGLVMGISGLVITIICLLIFGLNSFLLPSLTVVMLVAFIFTNIKKENRV